VAVTEDQRNARIFGVLFIITFVTSIPALALYQPVLDDPAGYIAGDGEDNQIYLGALLELLLIIANVGTAVVVYPILRRQNEILSLGYVTARLVECAFIGAGIIFVLGIVSLRQDSPDAADLAVSLAALKDWTFLLGPGFIVGWGNGLILGYLMYSSRLVPRWMAWLGLIGGPLINPLGDRQPFRLVGRRQHGAGYHGDPRVPVGVVSRHLRRRLGVQAGLADPLAGWRVHTRPCIGRVGRLASSNWPQRGVASCSSTIACASARASVSRARTRVDH
jgi:Domain of unknown function (DUF4386)